MADGTNGGQAPPQQHGTAPPPGSGRTEAFGRGQHPDDKPQQGEDQKQDQRDKGGGDEKDDPAKKKEDERPFYKRPVLMIILVTVAVAAVIAGTLTLVHERHYESTDDAFIDGRIIHVAPRVAGKVMRLNVDDNQIVAADTELITIDPAPFQVMVDQGQASVVQAEAQLAQSRANETVAEANADQSDADVLVAKANAINAEKDFERFNKVSAAARTQQQVDLATANQASTQAQVVSAQKKAIAMHAMVVAAEKTTASGAAAVKAAQANLEQANLNLQYTHVTAGYPGRVTRRSVETGNYVAVNQELLSIVPTDVKDLWVTANFKETQLTHIQRGQKVTISIDAFPDDPLQGTVDSIQNGTGAVFNLLPPENATGNYVKVVQRVPVKITIDGHPNHLLSPGLSVEPEVNITARPDVEADKTNAARPASPDAPTTAPAEQP